MPCSCTPIRASRGWARRSARPRRFARRCCTRIRRRPRHRGPAGSGDRILVSGGGGRFAERLYLTAIAAHALLDAKRPPMLVVAGPLCPPEDRRSPAHGSGERPARADRTDRAGSEPRDQGFGRLGEPVRLQHGLDAIRARVPALVVPFADNGDSEQTERASRLERLDVLRACFRLTHSSPRRSPPPSNAPSTSFPQHVDFDLDGATYSARALAMLLRHAERVPGLIRFGESLDQRRVFARSLRARR